MTTEIPPVALRAYERFCAGFTTGRWEPFFDLVSEQVDFSWPAEPGAGTFTGEEGRAVMEERFRFFGGEYRMTDITPTATTVAGDTVVFEDDSRGDMAGAPYHARHCIFFTFADDRITGYREYIAQVPTGS